MDTLYKAYVFTVLLKEYHPEYKANILKLKKFVMVRFLRDTTVVPNISSVFDFAGDIYLRELNYSIFCY